jgi:RsiW-degrading membrane proteinase PrsW (M82 family)
MDEPSSDPSILHEPHLREPDGAGPPVADNIPTDTEPTGEWSEHTVWDEPALSGDLLDEHAERGVTYAQWYEDRRARTGIVVSVLVTIGLAIAAGPLAVVGTFWGGGTSWQSILALVVFGPAVEEVMKSAAILHVVEKWPYLFRCKVQIVLGTVMSGVVFAAIENVLYLYVYVSEPTPGLTLWRWTVCVALHAGCCAVTSLGLARVWHTTHTTRTRPVTTIGYPFLITAVIIHGAYNAGAVLLSMTSFQF